MHVHLIIKIVHSQAFQYHKAQLFSDSDSAHLILACDNPSKQKQLGRPISNFDNNKWCEERDSLLEGILRNRFTHIPDVKHYLRKTGISYSLKCIIL